MILYEVNLTIQDSIFSAYLDWLRPHIKEMLTLPGFLSADFWQPTESSSSEHHQVTIMYHLATAEAMDNYLANYAPKMRADGLARFSGQFTATRRIMTQLDW